MRTRQHHDIASLRDYLPQKIIEAFVTTTPKTVDHLTQAVATWRKRPIITVGWDNFPVGLFGARIATRTRDYIVYDRNTTLVHRDHLKAHELGHVIAEHRIAFVSDDTPIEWAIANLLMRSKSRQDSFEEMEAEAIAIAIQIEIIGHNTLAAITQTRPTSPGWERLSNGLGWND